MISHLVERLLFGGVASFLRPECLNIPHSFFGPLCGSVLFAWFITLYGGDGPCSSAYALELCRTSLRGSAGYDLGIVSSYKLLRRQEGMFKMCILRHNRVLCLEGESGRQLLEDWAGVPASVAA